MRALLAAITFVSSPGCFSSNAVLWNSTWSDQAKNEATCVATEVYAPGMEAPTKRYYNGKGRLVFSEGQNRSGGWRERFEYYDKDRILTIVSEQTKPPRDGNCDVEGGCSEPKGVNRTIMRFEYDGARRLTKKFSSENRYHELTDGTLRHLGRTMREVFYSYNTDRQLSQIKSGDYTAWLDYDDGKVVARRYVRKGDSEGRTEVRYDAEGRINEIDLGSHKYIYSYDSYNRLVRSETVSDLQVYYWTLAYDELGRLSERALFRGQHGADLHKQPSRYRYRGNTNIVEHWTHSNVEHSVTYEGDCNALEPQRHETIHGPRAQLLGDLCVKSPHGELLGCGESLW